MVKNSDKDRLLEPVLVKNMRKSESSREYINIAPFLDSIDYIDYDGPNPMEGLGDFIGRLARFIATAYFEGGIIMEDYTKEDIAYSLFYLEEGLKKSTLVNM